MNKQNIGPLTTDEPVTSPVLFIIFNRPETTRQVFEAIKKARPTRLYIAADGPRRDRVGDAEKCEEARRIATAIDWECNIHTLFRDENLGCGKGPCTAITWFFEHETEGIILEDDCLPSPSFFGFCTELLHRYRDDKRVMEIGGNNLQPVHQQGAGNTYQFSNLIYIWGWATWRRAWKFYDFHMNKYKEINEKGYLENSYDTIYAKDFWQYVFGKMYKGDERTNSRTIWDYQWQFACKINSGLIIVPNRNLVRNLGFGELATNTRNPNGAGHDLALQSIQFPLKHPDFMMVNNLADRHVFKVLCTSPSSKVKSHIKNILPTIVLDRMAKPLHRLLSQRPSTIVSMLKSFLCV